MNSMVIESPALVAQRLSLVLSELQPLLGERLKTGLAIREQHGRDESAEPCMPPDAVVMVHSVDEIVAVAKACHRHRVPMIPYGAGTSLEGHLQAVRGGISIDVSEMNRVLQVRPADMDVTVQPGISRKQLNAQLNGTGLFFPIDPGADASVGGMCATRASGTNAVRYGTMRDNVLSLLVVLPDGRLLRTAGRARKSAAGYDLTRLFVGSAGTLGIIAEVTLKLHPLPEAVSAAVCSYPSVDAAVQTVIDTIQMGVPVARIELLDALSIQAINRYSQLQLPEQPTLFFEFHGSPHSVEEQAQWVQDISAAHEGSNFQWSTRPEERSRLWQARHDAYFAALALRPGCKALTTDAVVPIAMLGQCIALTLADFEDLRLVAPVLGHVGDGNFHAIILVDPDNADELARAKEACRRLAQRALAMEGTVTGEHGVGLTKQQQLIDEVGEAGIDVMRAIKHAIDPHELMNPGKIFRTDWTGAHF